MGNELVKLCTKIKDELFIRGLKIYCSYVNNYSTFYCNSKRNYVVMILMLCPLLERMAFIARQ